MPHMNLEFQSIPHRRDESLERRKPSHLIISSAFYMPGLVAVIRRLNTENEMQVVMDECERNFS